MSIQLPEDINEDDIYQWLNDGYVRVNGVVCQFLGDVSYRRSEYSARFYPCSEDDDESFEAKISDVECYWPICGAVNKRYRGKGVAVYVEREQRRQWRRTFNLMCVNALPIHRWSIHRAFGRTRAHRVTHITNDLVLELFDPTYPTLREAIDRIADRSAVSVAVSPQVSIVGDGKGTYALYHRTNMVGGLCNGTFTPTGEGSFGVSLVERLVKEVFDNDNDK